MTRIATLLAREILDSRGNPTVEAEVHLSDGSVGISSVPSGASVGKFEAIELRDADQQRYSGKGVSQAVDNVINVIAPRIHGMGAVEQAEVDAAMLELDGTPNKSKLGANAILGVSLAVAHAAARSIHKPLFEHLNELFGNHPMRMPVPMMNILNGGAHANNNVDIQEFMVVPTGGGSFAESLRCGVEIFQSLRGILAERGISTAVGDEGGFAPDLDSDVAALDLMREAVEGSGYSLGDSVLIALDCAASEFFHDGSYRLSAGGVDYSSNAWCEFLTNLVRKYPAVVSIEDGMAETDYEGWRCLLESIGDDIQIVGDDLFVTNLELLKKGVEQGWANAVLVKLNQIGTLSETLEVLRYARDNDIATVISHRSGETEDTTIADLAVATGAGQIKTGSLSRTERTAKYNRLLRIEEMMQNAEFRGKLEFNRFQGRNGS